MKIIYLSDKIFDDGGPVFRLKSLAYLTKYATIRGTFYKYIDVSFMLSAGKGQEEGQTKGQFTIEQGQ